MALPNLPFLQEFCSETRVPSAVWRQAFYISYIRSRGSLPYLLHTLIPFLCVTHSTELLSGNKNDSHH